MFIMSTHETNSGFNTSEDPSHYPELFGIVLPSPTEADKTIKRLTADQLTRHDPGHAPMILDESPDLKRVLDIMINRYSDTYSASEMWVGALLVMNVLAEIQTIRDLTEFTEE